MLDPPLFGEVVRRLSPAAPPRLDAFAAPHNAQLPTFWSLADDAFQHDWWHDRPLWANPPFSLLARVLRKVTVEGGHLLLLAPEWCPQLPALVALSTRSWLLPAERLFRVRGATLLPAPRWRTLAMLICRPPTGIKLASLTPHSTSTPTPLDVPFIPLAEWSSEASACPRPSADGVVPLFSYGRTFVRLGDAVWDTRGASPLLCPRCGAWQWPWDCPTLLVLEPRGRPTAQPSPTFVLTGTGDHLAVRLGVRPRPRSSPYPDSRGKGARRQTKLPECWQPAAPSDMGHGHRGHTGRGEALLTCGDVEANPGPKRSAPVSASDAPDPGNDSLDLAHPVTDLGVDGATVVDPAGHTVHLRALPAATPAPSPGAPFVKPVHIDRVLQLRLSVVRHVPGRVSRDFAAAMGEAVTRYAQSPNDDTLFGVLALPKLCLRRVPVKGKFSVSELEMSLLRRLDLFRRGDWQTLWAEATADTAPSHSVVETRAAKRLRQGDDSLPDAGVRRACTLVGEGAPAKAIQFLLSDGLHQASDPEVQARLRALHPPGRPVDPAALPPLVQPFEDMDSVPWESLVRDSKMPPGARVAVPR